MPLPSGGLTSQIPHWISLILHMGWVHGIALDGSISARALPDLNKCSQIIQISKNINII